MAWDIPQAKRTYIAVYGENLTPCCDAVRGALKIYL